MESGGFFGEPDLASLLAFRKSGGLEGERQEVLDCDSTLFHGWPPRIEPQNQSPATPLFSPASVLCSLRGRFALWESTNVFTSGLASRASMNSCNATRIISARVGRPTDEARPIRSSVSSMSASTVTLSCFGSLVSLCLPTLLPGLPVTPVSNSGKGYLLLKTRNVN